MSGTTIRAILTGCSVLLGQIIGGLWGCYYAKVLDDSGRKKKMIIATIIAFLAVVLETEGEYLIIGHL